MIKFKKITAVMMSVIMFVCLFAIPASAKEFNIKPNKKVVVPTNISKNYYYFTINEETDVWIEYTINTSKVWFQLFNEKDEHVGENAREASIGTCKFNGWEVEANWDKYKEKGQGRFRYTLKAGTYCLRVDRLYDTGTGKISFTVSAPEDDSSPEIDYITMTVDEGTKITLGAVLTTNSKKSVKWSSSNKTVASITSKGVLTAKAEGTTTITGKVGDSTVKIKVKVK